MIVWEQLRNIQSMIRLTKGNLEALNARFAQYQHPPSMYIAEYEDLTSKLNDFQRQEEKLLELMNYCDYEDSPIDTDCNNYELLANASSGSGSGSSQPRTPLKSVIRAHLPNQQRTTVQVFPGQTVREALSKAMRRRKLTTEMCSVYINNPKWVLFCAQFVLKLTLNYVVICRQPIEWDRDISLLEGHEILVETRERFPIQTSISHNYVKQLFPYESDPYFQNPIVWPIGPENILHSSVLWVLSSAPIPRVPVPDVWHKVSPEVCKCRTLSMPTPSGWIELL